MPVGGDRQGGEGVNLGYVYAGDSGLGYSRSS